MKFKPFFVLLCTSLAAIPTSASSVTCDDLTQSEQTLNQTSIQLYNIETKVIKASNDQTPLPEDLVGSDTSDRDAALRKLSSAFERLRTTLQLLNDRGSGRYSASIEKLDEQLHSFQAKLSSKGSQKVSHDVSSQASGQGTMGYDKLLRTVRAMRKFSDSANKVLAAAIRKKCASGSLEARQDVNTILTDLETMILDLLDDLNNLLDGLGDLLTLLKNLWTLLNDKTTLLISFVQSIIDGFTSAISTLLG